MRLDDTDLVHREYTTEDGLVGRRAAYRYAEGPSPEDMVVAALRETAPARVLEVGCGTGELAARIRDELTCDVVALDQSERMVELTRGRGLEALVADVAELPFGDASFDAAVAAFMLYHVPNVDRALGEIARVLTANGRFVAVTNGRTHKQELRALVGLPPLETTFSAENGGEQLQRHFARVDRREAGGAIVFPSHAEAQAHVDASILLTGSRALPVFDGPLRVTRAAVVFVADVAA